MSSNVTMLSHPTALANEADKFEVRTAVPENTIAANYGIRACGSIMNCHIHNNNAITS